MTKREAERILKTHNPHSSDCGRHETGLWDRSGNCERCNAFVALNEALIPAVG